RDRTEPNATCGAFRDRYGFEALIAAWPRSTRPQGLLDGGPGAGGGEGGGVAPGQVADALLVSGGGVELLAELEVIAVEYDGLQHLVAGGLQRRRGRGW